jgi:hypothetical protein
MVPDPSLIKVGFYKVNFYSVSLLAISRIKSSVPSTN